MPHVMLKPNWPGNFRRVVGKGRSAKTIVFQPGVPVDLKANQVKAIEGDLGKALLPVELDDKGRPRVITDEVVAVEDPEDEVTEDQDSGEESDNQTESGEAATGESEASNS